MTDEWKQGLQENNIQPYLSAAPWRRGRTERHGGIIKEMLDRIDHEKPIESLQQFDDACPAPMLSCKEGDVNYSWI